MSKAHRELREERLSLMKTRVRAQLGHELNVDYDMDVDDTDDQELLALEAERVHDEADLPGKNLNVRSVLRKFAYFC